LLKNKPTKLKAIEREVENLSTSPLYEYRTKSGYHAVPGSGDPDARIMFIGEAPGKQEALSGRPFVGAAGKFLDKLLQSVGLDRRQIFITNILKDRPPDNRPPQRGEIELYTPFLRRQIEIIQPEVIVTLGRFAMEFILTELNMPERGGKISELHGRTLRAKTSYGDVAVLPLFHPAVALYRRELKEVLEDDFQGLRAYAQNEKKPFQARQREAVTPP
jgi:DNA polymerase